MLLGDCRDVQHAHDLGEGVIQGDVGSKIRCDVVDCAPVQRSPPALALHAGAGSANLWFHHDGHVLCLELCHVDLQLLAMVLLSQLLHTKKPSTAC